MPTSGSPCWRRGRPRRIVSASSSSPCATTIRSWPPRCAARGCPQSSSRPSSPVGGPPAWRSFPPGSGRLPVSRERMRREDMSDPKPRIAILGAGPTGLEAALAAAGGGFPFTVYEASPEVAGNVRAWGHVRLFTPWAMNVSPRMRRHLSAVGIETPDGAGCPTGRELAERLFAPLAKLPEIAPHLRLGSRVLGIGREGLLKHEEIATAARGRRPFRLLLADDNGREWTETADLVIDATGTWGNPNTLGDAGIPAPGERAFGSEIRRDIPDFAREAADWAGRTVLLAGAGHSAQTAVRDLARLAQEAPDTEVIWLLRNPEPAWGT